MTDQTNEAPAPELDLGSPYVGGGESFDDELSPEEQAIYEQEMSGTDEEPEPEEPAAEVTQEEPEQEAPAEQAPEATQQDQAELDAANPTTEEEPQTEETPAPEAPQEQPRIPKARLDREMAKRHALEQELAELKAKQGVETAQADDTPVEVEIDAEAITKALDMNLDGKNSEAAGIIVEQLQTAVAAGVAQGREQMRQELKASTEAAVTQAVGQVTAKTVEQAYSDAVTEVESKYPVFNPDSDTFDSDLANKAITMMNAFQADGMSPAEALQEAADLTLLRHKPELLRQNTQAVPETKPKNESTEQSRKRNVAAAAAQPTREGGQPTKASDNVIDFDKLTEEEFDALPESVLAESRGDML